MEEIASYLKIYNDRHPEYHGYATTVIYDDGSGYLGDASEGDEHYEIRGTGFKNLESFKIVCETK